MKKAPPKPAKGKVPPQDKMMKGKPMPFKNGGKAKKAC